MGYYTRFELSWSDQQPGRTYTACEHEKPKIAKFCPTCGVAAKWSLDDMVEQYIGEHEEFGVDKHGGACDSCKWYEHEVDVTQVPRCPVHPTR